MRGIPRNTGSNWLTGSKYAEYPKEEVVQKREGNLATNDHNNIISACKVGNPVAIVKCWWSCSTAASAFYGYIYSYLEGIKSCASIGLLFSWKSKVFSLPYYLESRKQIENTRTNQSKLIPTLWCLLLAVASSRKIELEWTRIVGQFSATCFQDGFYFFPS